MVESFVLRVRTGPPTGALAGELEVVASGHRVLFRTGDELVALLVAMTALAPPDPTSSGAGSATSAGEVPSA